MDSVRVGFCPSPPRKSEEGFVCKKAGKVSAPWVIDAGESRRAQAGPTYLAPADLSSGSREDAELVSCFNSCPEKLG